MTKWQSIRNKARPGHPKSHVQSNQAPSMNTVQSDCLPNHISKLPHGILVSGKSVTLGVIKHVSSIRVTNVVESHGPVHVGVKGAN